MRRGYDAYEIFKAGSTVYVKVHNWVRPNLEQTMSLSEGMRNHILNGGLILEDELK